MLLDREQQAESTLCARFAIGHHQLHNWTREGGRKREEGRFLLNLQPVLHWSDVQLSDHSETRRYFWWEPLHQLNRQINKEDWNSSCSCHGATQNHVCRAWQNKIDQDQPASKREPAQKGDWNNALYDQHIPFLLNLPSASYSNSK